MSNGMKVKIITGQGIQSTESESDYNHRTDQMTENTGLPAMYFHILSDRAMQGMASIAIEGNA